MKTYGQFCPVAKAAELFCERWTPLIVRDLAAGAHRFSELQRGVPLMSPSLLSKRLKQLEAEGIVERRRAGKVWTYHLTGPGLEFVPMVEALGVWGQRWSRRELAEHEADIGLLVWAIERAADATAFGDGRTVIRMEVTDQPDHKRLWWFVNEDGKCELCVHDPGHEVDIYLGATLHDMIYVVRGDLALASALDSGRLEALGPRKLTRRLGAWFNLGPVTQVASVREEGRAVGA